MSGELPVNPIGHSEAVVCVGNLVEAIEEDHAPPAAKLALPPASWFLARSAADGVPYDVW